MSRLFEISGFVPYANADAWGQRQIGEVAEQSTGGGTPSTSNEDFWGGDIPWLQSSDLTEHDLFGINARKRITQNGLKNSAAKLVSANSIAILTRVGVGKLVVVPFEYTTSQDFLSLSTLNIDVLFGAYSIYTRVQKDLNQVQGTSIKGITKDELLNKMINVPHNGEEQTAIGNFFRTLDNALTLHKRKLDGLKALKKAYLQQMFPQNRESVPRLRFSGFTGDWQEQKLGDVAEITGGGTPDTTNSEYWDGDIDWYSPVEIGGEIYSYSSQRKITELGLKKSSAKILPADRTILFTSRAGIGDMAILKSPAATNQGFQSLVVNSDNNVYFIYSMGSKIKEYALKNASGSTFLEISGKGLSKMDILVPSKDEQDAIGQFFHNLDERITSQTLKMEQLRKLKAAYLQKMFI